MTWSKRRSCAEGRCRSSCRCPGWIRYRQPPVSRGCDAWCALTFGGVLLSAGHSPRQTRRSSLAAPPDMGVKFLRLAATAEDLPACAPTQPKKPTLKESSPMNFVDIPLPNGSAESLVRSIGVAPAAAVLVLAGFGLFRLLWRSGDFRWRRVRYAAYLAADLVVLVGAGVLGWHWHESAIQTAPILPGAHFIESMVSDVAGLVGLLLGVLAAKSWADSVR